jgi:hypothetical protein
MRGRFKAGVLVIACAAALGVAGCGGDDDETTSTTSTTTTETSATGPTGAEGDTTTTDDSGGDPEGTAEVQDLLETAFTAQGLSSGEATCVDELVAPTVAGESIEKLQDPTYVEGLLQDQKEDIENCEGQ